ncbi:MAG: gamma-glutamyltransferase, partial [Methylococcaceae bacterium]|nr:gamma-glutamyltransferase [Methylococcaceae bacterium]
MISKLLKKCALSSLIVIMSITSAHATDSKAAIATAHPLATEAGFEILKKGGNAFDAAVAISAALAVVEPSGSGLGGGGFLLLHRAKDGFETMIDGREKAPLAASKDMYLDEKGEVIKGLSKEGGLAAAIPGLPAAMVHLAEKYGRLSLKESLQPAIRYATEGFSIGERHRKLLGFRKKLLQQNPEAAQILLEQDKIPANGSLLKQSDLAKTLQLIADKGKAGFYQGEVAEKLISSVNKTGGIWSQQDLDNYKIIERIPVYGNYKGIKITSAALPSSGGIVLVETLNILAAYDLSKFDNIARKHLISEAMRRAYHDRALYLGDNDFIKVPVAQLLNKDYAAGLRSTIRMDKALPSQELSGENKAKTGGRNTTHFSIIDAEGNRVSATLSIN